MSALTIHFREPGEHGALPFHPGCPLCRSQRLHGTLDDRWLVSVRTQAAIAAGVLALSATAPVPAAVAAGEPPSEHEGQLAPEDPGAPGDSSQSPDFDPGGPQVDLPVSVGPDDPEAESEAPEPLESEPATDPGLAPEPPATLDVPPESPVEVDVQEQPTPNVGVPEAPTPQPLPAPGAPPLEPAPSAPVEPEPVDDPTAPGATKPERPARGETQRWEQRPRHSPTPTPAPEVPASQTASSETVTVEAPPSTPTVPADSGSPSVNPGDRAHVVQPGESLWSIARTLLGPDASIAEVAREVSGLWTLNRERIGTGDPDLILPGTRLRLR